MGNDINIISLETMKNLYEIVATNLKLAREKEDPPEQPPLTKLQPGDTVLVQNYTKGPFDPKYIGNYRVVSLKENQVEIQPAIGGPTEMKHIKHVKYVLPTDKYISQLPNYSQFGRKTMLGLNPDHILELHWKLTDTTIPLILDKQKLKITLYMMLTLLHILILSVKVQKHIPPKVNVNLLSVLFYLLLKY